MTQCFHCGLPADGKITAKIDNQPQPFCCEACRLVALTISEGGLSSYYRFRDQLAEKPRALNNDFLGYDLPEVQLDFVHRDADNLAVARLSIQGISCAACAWLIEKHLGEQRGVSQVRVNATTRRCTLRWNPETAPLSTLLNEIQRIGYQPLPDRIESNQLQRKAERHQAFMRLGVAGIGMMQVGMVAVALYSGDHYGIEQNWQSFLRWVSLVIATPVVFFSAAPFFLSAARALKARHLNMDVPVSLAIGLAYAASAFATLTGTGDVYFDSVSMFTFFLLLGRFLEMRARHSSAFASENLRQLLPLTVTRMDDAGSKVSVPLSALQPGDQVWVNAGDMIPADGVLTSDQASVDESILTGESLPQIKKRGDSLCAGTLNRESALQLHVVQTGANTQLAAIEQLVEQAALQKPRQIAFADLIAGRFVAAVLVLSVIVAFVWWHIEPERALWVVLSVLVVTCPCALSLATPAALTAGLNRARRLGVLISGPQVMESLARLSHVVFDKTGTLTEGHLRLLGTAPPGSGAQTSEAESLSIIATLEQYAQHPIADVFREFDRGLVASDVSVSEGEGVCGCVNGTRYRFGRPEFAAPGVAYPDEDAQILWQLLAAETGAGGASQTVPLRWIKLGDCLRESAIDAVNQLVSLNRDVTLLSGDRNSVVADVATAAGIADWAGEARPADKLQWLNQQQAQGARVLMVGDGINDVPVLSAADISMAMGSATRLAQSKADSILLNGNLTAIPAIIVLSARVQKIIRQNLTWALVYNLVALPAAATGILPPWLAAIGMSASSLVVVLNAMRT
ncbi:heavy metal translocating P-type ATPase [Teredinibacter turnerae]|uniref:heavy metal translocating P-type ATPase n=1 Tax=Teredinibacter turnerae TaxID=2426 RepID=UPI00037E8DFC|nr:heavy metal translocating P-type ATPase [Teredinibacter turnerae]